MLKLSFGKCFFFRNFLDFEMFFLTSDAFHITRKLWRKTGLTVAVNLYTHIYSAYVGGVVYGKVVLK